LLLLLLAVPALFFLATLTTQCGREEPGITFMAGGEPNEIAYWETLIEEFEAQSGLQVRLIRQPADSDQRREELVVPLRSAKHDPDVFLMDVVWVAQLAGSDWLEPLESSVEKGDFSLDPFLPGIVDLADRYGGHLVALPIYIDGGLLYYRKDLLAKYGLPGPPQTWNDLVDYSLTVQEGERKTNPSFYAFVWQGAQYEGLICSFLEFAASSEAWRVRHVDGYQAGGPGSGEALALMRDLIHEHGVSPPNTYTEMKEEQCRIFFQNGNALFERNWPYAWMLHNGTDSPVRGKVGIAPLPHFPKGESVSTLGGWHIGISRTSDKKGESWDFVKYCTSFEVQKRLALNLGWNPSRTDVYEDKAVIGGIPHLGLLRGIFENAVSRPRVPYYSQVSDMLQRHINACLAGETTENEALDAIGEEYERLRARYDRESR
jgi:multiple sugar transport system substrate-binding protein